MDYKRRTGFGLFFFLLPIFEGGIGMELEY